MHPHHRIAFVLRIFFATLILLAIWGQAWGAVFLNTFLFIATLFLHEMGKKDPRYYALDAFAIAVFAGSMLFGLSGLYTVLNEGNILGIDKLFHMLGGAGIAWFALLWWDHELKGWREWVQVLALTLVLGLGWELLEMALASLPLALALPHGGLYDTAWDLVADMLGAVVVCFIWFRRKQEPAKDDLLTIVKKARKKKR